MKSTLIPPGESAQTEWLELLAADPELCRLFAPAPSERIAAGYGHTLVEICQQPSLWADTAARVADSAAWLSDTLEGVQWVVLTGSGSSQYVGECVRSSMQAETGIPVFAFGGGCLLMDGVRAVPSARPGLVVSLARSGDSPESAAVLALFLKEAPDVRHLVITCNTNGRLCTRFRDNPQVRVLALDPRTNDRSLAMTSSFTNMVLAVRGLGLLPWPGAHLDAATRLSQAARELLRNQTSRVAQVARGPFEKVVYLASGSRLGAARESALKMLEMNVGKIPTLAETYLGLRHGPMCVVDSATLLVCFLANGHPARAYEEDLIAELNRKQLGARKLLVGEHIPATLLGDGDVAVEIPGLSAIGDDSAPVLDALIGQLLAFFRCLGNGLKPDTPSSGVISRVVNEFAIHHGEGKSNRCRSWSPEN